MFFHTILRRVRRSAVGTSLAAAAILGPVAVSTSVHAAPADATDDIEQDDRMAPSIACPLVGPSQFIDSWGAGRSGGRQHQGVDMIADRGTPVVAVRSGTAEFKRSGLGGNAIWLTTVAGDRYYYAHLDSFEGASRSVVRGEVIGYVGSTGNAGGPHLHFETHPNAVAANPFAAVFSACVGPATPVTFGAMQAVGGRQGAGTPTETGGVSAHQR